MDWRLFATQMATMARDLLAQESLDATLERITASAVELVEGCDAAGILVLHDRRVRTLAATEQVVVDSDRLQERAGEGPCFDAARRAGGRRLFRIADFAAEAARWPVYLSYADGLGLGSMMGFLLFTEDEDLGALDMYSRARGAFGEASETAGWMLASHAAVAFSSARTDAQMREALATRHTIGEAMGILMGRHGLTEEQAFDVLRTYSQEKNVKLRQVAERVCSTGGTDG
ncbi:transcription antitermination regulator [Streptomyces ruber]|uniref:Transcription antitermination regulator n=2 Tax=Streptomyces TaxID=1883 RepID=A0A918BLL4_9ACTN|nr:GAF and ANTAR domain-containing protein [Streptomyces ruber]GGQ75325.1 transcription antitermination regulator [Streptomyces ruber]